MSARGRRILWILIAGGALVRIAWGFGTVGIGYDVDSFHMAAARLQEPHPFELYADLTEPFVRWPYPPAYLPFLLLADWFTVPGLLPFHGLMHVPPAAADAGLAWIAQAYLGDRGAAERTRLAAAAVVAFGPSFLVVSGYEGQLDTVAILPAAAALLVWGRLPPGRRALAAGALIGLGGALKTVPLVMVLALLPHVRGWREAGSLLGAAFAVPLVALAPWLIAEPDGTIEALRYAGIPGLGGLSLLTQPGLAEAWLVTERFPQLSPLTDALVDARFPLLAGALAAVGVLLVRRRPEPAAAALLVWLAVFVSAVNFGPRYLVWALPFALMAGYVREAALLQALAGPAAMLIAARTWEPQWVAPVYVVLMLALLAAFLVWLLALAYRSPRAVVAPRT